MVNRGLRPHRDRVELGVITLAQKRAVAPKPDQRAADVACWLIPELFEVGFSLASSASILDEPARSEITAAVDRLDEIIAELRAAGREPT